jgi:uncharacterized protein (TIGR02301 family)
MRPRRIALLVAAAMLGWGLALARSNVAAQSRPAERPAPRSEPKAPSKPPAPSPPLPPAPYEGALLRLSEVMGALAFLRELCGQADGSAWRERTQSLLDAEASEPDRRARLAGAFNRGYQGYALTYRVCTPAARTAIDRYLVEGGKLARDLSARWGG